MLDRLTRGQFVAFVTLTVVAVTFASVAYVRLPEQLGVGRYKLAVMLPDTANLYPRALVTLSGVPVGSVDRLELGDGEVRVEVSIDSGTQVPAGSQVEVRSVSAIGEQYLNFEPQGGAGDALPEEAVVPVSAFVPTASADAVLRNVNDLIATLPEEDLNTTVRELSAAFAGSGDDLQRLLDSSDALLASASENLDPTRDLIRDLGPVLDTQVRTGDDVKAWAANLAHFTDELRSSDEALRAAIRETPTLTGEVDALVSEVRPVLPDLLQDLTSVAQVTRAYIPNIAHTVNVLQAMNNALYALLKRSPIPGTAKLDFVAAVNDPPPCTQGFEQEQYDPLDEDIRRPAAAAFCDESPTSAINVRGTRNSPCPNDADLRSKDAAGCGLHFQGPEEAAAAQEAAIATMLDVAARLPNSRPRGDAPDQPLRVGDTEISTPYDSGTGLFVGPDGSSYLLGGADGPPEDDGGWQSLVLDPMGIER